MRLRPMPVVMVSSLTGKGSKSPARAGAGAVDFVPKPQLGIREGMLAYSEMIAEKIRTASRAKLAAHKPITAPATLKAGPLLELGKTAGHWGVNRGTEAIRHVPAIAAFKPGYPDYAAYAAGLYPLIRGAPE